jgi:WD40 repeat protein
MRDHNLCCRISYHLLLLLVVAGVLCPRAALLHGGEKDKQPFIALKHSFVVSCLAFSPDGNTLATGCHCIVVDREVKEVPGDVMLWDATTGKVHETLKGHAKSVISVAYGPNGKTIASASGDKTVKLWDITSRKEETSFELPFRPECVAFSADLKTFGNLALQAKASLVKAAAGTNLYLRESLLQKLADLKKELAEGPCSTCRPRRS